MILSSTANAHKWWGSSGLCPLAFIEPPPLAGLSGAYPQLTLSNWVAYFMKSRNFSDRTTCRHALDLFTGQGIAAGRIELISVKPSFPEHLDTYNRIDIGLDTFPYNGTTTTCEAIWMGVPVIALSGNTHASRVGLSLLTNLGLQELVAGTFEEYISIAAGLAVDLDRLQKLRKSLRDRMTRSPLTDAKRFGINLETCYREMWAQWCTHGHISSSAGKDRS